MARDDHALVCNCDGEARYCDDNSDQEERRGMEEFHNMMGWGVGPSGPLVEPMPVDFEDSPRPTKGQDSSATDRDRRLDGQEYLIHHRMTVEAAATQARSAGERDPEVASFS